MAVKNNRIGEENRNKIGSIMQIVEYRNSKDIDVYFPEYNWLCKHSNYNSFKNGGIKCPYEPRCCGIGYCGEGIYETNYNSKDANCYHTWYDMLLRCYSDNYHESKPTYIDCYVCDEWLNYQNFAEWYYDNYYEIDNEIMNLDKDILYKGNKIYSPETCVFVPQCINSLFVKSNSIRGVLPIGVRLDKRRNKYSAQSNNGHKQQIFLGYYDTPESAFYAYKNYKENLIKQFAEDYKDCIPYNLYEAMYNYEISIND